MNCMVLGFQGKCGIVGKTETLENSFESIFRVDKPSFPINQHAELDSMLCGCVR